MIRLGGALVFVVFSTVLLGGPRAHAQQRHDGVLAPSPRSGPFLPTTPTNPWMTRLGFTNQWRLTGTRSAAYAAGMDYQVTREGQPSGFITATRPNADGLASVTQKQPAEPFRTKRIRFGAWVKVEDVSGWAALWMRIDGQARRVLAFDNMQDRPLAGTREWTWCEVVLDVPADATTISYGLLLHASGTAWVNGLVLEEVKPETPSTDLLKPKANAVTTPR